MAPDFPYSAAIFQVFVAWALFYAPGHALVARGTSSLPTLFARIVASAVATTLVATGLAAAESFSLPHLLAGNAVASFLLLLLRQWLLGEDRREASAPRDFVGPALFAIALASYWPAYSAFLGGSDSTAYVASGVSLARHGSLGREDLLGQSLPLPVKSVLFDSMSQVFLDIGPPFRRVPGAMLLEHLDDKEAWPCFFPVPSVWSAVSTLRDGSLRETAAADFAPLFGALAVWAFWLLARQWVGAGWGLAATVMLAASGPFYAASRMPMSEPVAAFFAMAGLAYWVAASVSARRTDALLAGAALGAAVFTRLELAVLLLFAFSLAPVFLRRGESALAAPASRVFFAALVVVASLTAVEAALLPGTYLLPLVDHWSNAWVKYQLRFGRPSAGLLAAAALAALAGFAAASRAFGAVRLVRWGIVAGVVSGQAAAASFLYDRTPMWLSFYVGWSGIALFAIGAIVLWKDRRLLPGSAFVLALAAGVTAILFYNPHVFPSLPWGARRFVPLLLPLLVLFATIAARRLAARSRVAGIALLAALAWPIAIGARPTWNQYMLEGAWDQLQAVAKAIPQPGVILIDRELSRTMLGPSLWLILDRNNVTIPPLDTKIGGEMLKSLVWFYGDKSPVYFVTRGTGTQRNPGFVSMTPVGDAALRLRVLESAYNRLPERMAADVTPIAVYEVRKSLAKPGIVRPKGAQTFQ